MAACRISTRACGEMPRRVSVLSSSSLARRVRSARSVAGGLAQLGLLGAAGDLLLDEQADLLDRGRLALEVPLDGGVEDALDAAEVLPDLLDLLGDVEEEVHVLFLVAAEVMDAHVPDLAVAGHTTVALLELRGRPGDVVVDDPATALLHVDAFGGGIGRQQQPHGGGGVFELGLHRLELVERSCRRRAAAGCSCRSLPGGTAAPGRTASPCTR